MRREAEHTVNPNPTIEEMRQDLDRLGWKKYGGILAYQSPDGRIYRGPYLAWCVATGNEFKSP